MEDREGHRLLPAMFIEINILGKKVELEIVNRERFSRLLVTEHRCNACCPVNFRGQKGRPARRRMHRIQLQTSRACVTPLSEGSRPEELVTLLNDYFEQMVDILFKYEGTLDKFMGDGIMACVGAPAGHPR